MIEDSVVVGDESEGRREVIPSVIGHSGNIRAMLNNESKPMQS